MKFHPVADIFPLIQGDEFDALVADIRENGLREQIWTYEGRIIDGRNRYNACMKIGMDPIIVRSTLEVESEGVAHIESVELPGFREYHGEPGRPLDAMTPDEREEALVSKVVSLNLHRRHLDEGQRAMVAAKLANMGRGRTPSVSGHTENTQICGLTSQAQAAKLLNVSERSVSSAKKVVAEGVPELVEMVESGDLSVSAAAEIAKLPKARQRGAIKKGRAAMKKIVNRIRERSLREATKGGRVCVVCSPDTADNGANFMAALQLLREQFPSKTRYVESVIEEIASEDLSDETRANYDKVVGAIRAGFAEQSDLRRATGLDWDTFNMTIATMLDYNMIDFYFQGGKTDVARGARKKIYRIALKPIKDEGELTYEMDGDEDLDDLNDL